jgi:hypothetical protein
VGKQQGPQGSLVVARYAFTSGPSARVALAF